MKMKMKMNKTNALIGGAVLSGVAILATTTAHALRKNNESKGKAEDDSDNFTVSLAFEVLELREALLRSYATGIKLREDHQKMRAAIVVYAGEDAPVLEGIEETPENDPFVVSIAEREISLDVQGTCGNCAECSECECECEC